MEPASSFASSLGESPPPSSVFPHLPSRAHLLPSSAPSLPTPNFASSAANSHWGPPVHQQPRQQQLLPVPLPQLTTTTTTTTGEYQSQVASPVLPPARPISSSDVGRSSFSSLPTSRSSSVPYPSVLGGPPPSSTIMVTRAPHNNTLGQHQVLPFPLTHHHPQQPLPQAPPQVQHSPQPILQKLFPESPEPTHSSSPSSSSSSTSMSANGKTFVLSRSESFAFVREWLASVFEERKESAVSTRGVYDEYKCFCERKAIEVMCPSAFGKLFKKVFPNISVRRLGPRGENFNHYYNLGRKASPNSGHPAACDDGMASFPLLPMKGAIMPASRALPPLLSPTAASVYPTFPNSVPVPRAMLPTASPYPAGLTLPPPIPSLSLPPPHGASFMQPEQQLSYYQQLHNPMPVDQAFFPGSRSLKGAWHPHDIVSRIPQYREWYLSECWPFTPLNPAALEPETLQLFSVTDGPLLGRETLALSSFLAMSIAAFNLGDFEISRDFFNRARSQLGYLFDETSIDIAFVLQPLSLVSHWWTGKDSSAYYHTLLSEMCGQLHVLNSDLFISSLKTHYLMKTYKLGEWKKKIEAATKYPKCPPIPQHWNCPDYLLAKLHTQGSIWQDTITQLLEIVGFLSAYRKRRRNEGKDHHQTEFKKCKKRRKDVEDGSSEDEVRSPSSEENSAKEKLNVNQTQEVDESRGFTTATSGQRLATLREQMDRILRDQDWRALPRVPTIILKGLIMMVDIEHKCCLDFDNHGILLAKNLDGGEGEPPDFDQEGASLQNGRTAIPSVREGGQVLANTIKSEVASTPATKSARKFGQLLQSECASEEMVDFFASLDVPVRGVVMSIIHNFVRGPFIDILSNLGNTAALQRLLYLLSPLTEVNSLGEIRQRLTTMIS